MSVQVKRLIHDLLWITTKAGYSARYNIQTRDDLLGDNTSEEDAPKLLELGIAAAFSSVGQLEYKKSRIVSDFRSGRNRATLTCSYRTVQMQEYKASRPAEILILDQNEDELVARAFTEDAMLRS